MGNLMQILGLIPSIIATIKAVEEAIPMSGQGKAKTDMVIGIMSTVSDEISGIIPALERVISVIVSAFNTTGVFTKSA